MGELRRNHEGLKFERGKIHTVFGSQILSPENHGIVNTFIQVYGSVDPNSGTAVLAEVARAMVQTMNETGWKPG